MPTALLLLIAACTDPSGEPATDGPDEAPQQRAEALKGDCEGGKAVACTGLGRLHQAGTGVAQDAARAAELFSQGCGGGDPEGCVALAQMHERGDGVPRDLARVAELYQLGCDGGSSAACAKLGQMVRDGLGVDADIDRAVNLLRKACQTGHGDSCSELSSMYALGARLPRNPAESRRFAQRGCTQDHPFSCAQLADIQIRDGDERDARAILDGLLARDDGPGVPLVVVQGLRLVAGEKPEAVGPALIEAWKASRPGEGGWSWAAMVAYLGDAKRKKSRDLVVVIQLLDAPRSAATESALRAALGLPG